MTRRQPSLFPAADLPKPRLFGKGWAVLTAQDEAEFRAWRSAVELRAWRSGAWVYVSWTGMPAPGLPLWYRAEDWTPADASRHAFMVASADDVRVKRGHSGAEVGGLPPSASHGGKKSGIT